MLNEVPAFSPTRRPVGENASTARLDEGYLAITPGSLLGQTDPRRDFLGSEFQRVEPW